MCDGGNAKDGETGSCRRATKTGASSMGLVSVRLFISSLKTATLAGKDAVFTVFLLSKYRVSRYIICPNPSCPNARAVRDCVKGCVKTQCQKAEDELSLRARTLLGWFRRDSSTSRRLGGGKERDTDVLPGNSLAGIDLIDSGV